MIMLRSRSPRRVWGRCPCGRGPASTASCPRVVVGRPPTSSRSRCGGDPTKCPSRRCMRCGRAVGIAAVAVLGTVSSGSGCAVGDRRIALVISASRSCKREAPNGGLKRMSARPVLRAGVRGRRGPTGGDPTTARAASAEVNDRDGRAFRLGRPPAGPRAWRGRFAAATTSPMCGRTRSGPQDRTSRRTPPQSAKPPTRGRTAAHARRPDSSCAPGQA